MYEFHGWFVLAAAEDVVPMVTIAEDVLSDISNLLQRLPSASGAVRALNGELFVFVQGLINRERDEAIALTQLLELLGREVKGAYGMLYDRSDEMPDPPGLNAFPRACSATGRDLFAHGRTVVAVQSDHRRLGRQSSAGLLAPSSPSGLVKMSDRCILRLPERRVVKCPLEQQYRQLIASADIAAPSSPTTPDPTATTRPDSADGGEVLVEHEVPSPSVLCSLMMELLEQYRRYSTPTRTS